MAQDVPFLVLHHSGIHSHIRNCTNYSYSSHDLPSITVCSHDLPSITVYSHDLPYVLSMPFIAAMLTIETNLPRLETNLICLGVVGSFWNNRHVTSSGHKSRIMGGAFGNNDW